MKYTSYVTSNSLQSPITSYNCKRITKQNIKQFGFDSIKHLHEQYPDFPLYCSSILNQIVKNSSKTRKNQWLIIKQKEELIYLQNPNKCSQCFVALSYYNRKKRFCSQSCAAIYNNKLFPHTTKTEKHILLNCKSCGVVCKCSAHASKICCDSCNKKNIQERNKKRIRKPYIPISELQRKIRKSKPKFIGPKVYYCKICKSIRSSPHAKYCKTCFSNIRHYRSRCQFLFNIFQYPHIFDLYLITKFGWFSPNGYRSRNKTPNLTGVSRDHLYSVLDGFNNNVDPNLLSHPANCKLMVHNGPAGNNSKGSKSSITLDELKTKISNGNKTLVQVVGADPTMLSH